MTRILSSAPAGPVSYLFIDGECLNCTLQKIGARYFEGIRPVLNWKEVARGHKKTFYYGAISVQKPGEDENTHSRRVTPKRSELDEIESQPSFHVRRGDARHRKRRGDEQKMVDVQLAVDALSMASRGLFESCTLITGDLDFKPLVTALVDMGLDVQLLYPKDGTTHELKAAADTADAMTIMLCRQWFREDFAKRLPSVLVKPQEPAKPYLAVLTQWHDDRYGDCFVASDDGVFVLVTQREPLNPNIFQLELRTPKAEVLRAYAEEAYELAIPTMTALP